MNIINCLSSLDITDIPRNRYLNELFLILKNFNRYLKRKFYKNIKSKVIKTWCTLNIFNLRHLI